ncbi:unnamed protein product, partial [Medioppia subpectinata]
IPYAKPPVGELRFAKPEAIKTPLKDIIDGTKTTYACIQPNFPYFKDYIGNLSQSEDCLVLNIWTQNAGNDSTGGTVALKPVMFWMHGGALSIGSSYQRTPYYNWFNGTALASHDVVVVTINYRLGPFGFTYGGDNTAPGNAGFYDQLLALKWVRDNIHSFGGERDQITIFGHSAGSWSVSAHLLSPLSRGLFQRAIMQSGALLGDKKRSIVTKAEALTAAKQMAAQLNCTSDDNQWLQCLRSVDTNLIRDVTKETTFTIEEGTEFLPELAINAFNAHHFNPDVDLIAGVSRRDGSNLAVSTIPQLAGNLTKDIFKFLVLGVSEAFHDIDGQAVVDYYLKGVDTGNSDALKAAFYDFFGDVLMKCPTYLFARQYAKHSANSRVYFYEQSYQSRNAHLWGCVGPAMGVCHGAEEEFVFGVPLVYPNTFTATDVGFARYVTKMWTDFAKTG